MEENTQEQEKPEEVKPEEVSEEEKKNKTNLIELVNRLEKANKEAREIMTRNEQLIARGLLGGKTDNAEKEERPKEETPQEYAKRIMGGKL